MNQPIPPKLGKYEVIAPLGSGAQATVYRARQPGLEREVAIKVVALGSATASDFLARFEQEAQVAARLEHPNILPVHDYGEQDGFAYFVMRLVRNGTLAQRMASGRVPDEEALVILEQVARALDHAHARQVIHRDVKPANILLSDDGQALLADFGISKLLEGSSLESLPGSVPCTPAYSSPDPLAGDAPDGRSDQYSLAVIAYEMLGGRRPFDSGTPLDVMRDHALKSPPFHHPWFAARPTVVEVLGRALAKQRDQRFDSCIEFVTALRKALRVPLASSADVETGERQSELTRSAALSPHASSLQSSTPPPLPARNPDQPRAVEPPPIQVASPRPGAPEGVSAPGEKRGSPARTWALASLGVALLVAALCIGAWLRLQNDKPGSGVIAKVPDVSEDLPSASEDGQGRPNGSRAPTPSPGTTPEELKFEQEPAQAEADQKNQASEPERAVGEPTQTEPGSAPVSERQTPPAPIGERAKEAAPAQTDAGGDQGRGEAQPGNGTEGNGDAGAAKSDTEKGDENQVGSAKGSRAAAGPAKVLVKFAPMPFGSFDARYTTFRRWCAEQVLPQINGGLTLTESEDDATWIMYFEFRSPEPRTSGRQVTGSGDFYVSVLEGGEQTQRIAPEFIVLNKTPSAVARDRNGALRGAFEAGLDTLQSETGARLELVQILKKAVSP